MERYFSTGQSPQRAVAPTEEEEEEGNYMYVPEGLTFKNSTFCPHRVYANFASISE